MNGTRLHTACPDIGHAATSQSFDKGGCQIPHGRGQGKSTSDGNFRATHIVIIGYAVEAANVTPDVLKQMPIDRRWVISVLIGLAARLVVSALPR
jgi:hypothetical protein